MKKLKKTILTILVMIFSCFAIYSVTADSGWDSSYGGGGSSDGSSGSHGGSHSGSGGNNSEYWENSSITPGTAAIIFGCVWAVAMAILITSTIKREKKKQLQSGNVYNDFDESTFIDISEEKLKEIDVTINLKDLKNHLFETYKNIQISWMNFENDKIRNLTTDELYNMYSSQLETLKLKGQKNIMDDITLEDIKVIDIRKKDDVININAYLKVKCFDYVMNEKTNEVLRGTSEHKLELEYVITFVKSAERKDNKIKCPNCGALVEMNSSTECPFCGSTLVDLSHKYVMSKKTCIGQEVEV